VHISHIVSCCQQQCLACLPVLGVTEEAATEKPHTVNNALCFAAAEPLTPDSNHTPCCCCCFWCPLHRLQLLTVSVAAEREAAARELVTGMAPGAQLTYNVGGTLKYELPTHQVNLRVMQHQLSAGLWGMFDSGGCKREGRLGVLRWAPGAQLRLLLLLLLDASGQP
jgi:hypothetical protein